jgi:lysophospholipase L1-like esterase
MKIQLRKNRRKKEMKHNALHKILCFCLSFIMWQQVSAQQDYDSSFRFYYYDQKLSMFLLMPHREEALVWLGDSITDGGEWSELFPGMATLNRGISADNTFGILHRLHEVTKRKPKKVFLLIGINDIAKEVPVEKILDNYLKIVQQIKAESPKTDIWLQTLMPTHNGFHDFPKHQNKTEKILAVNEGIKQIAGKENTNLIDLNAAFADTDGKLDTRFTNDGLHLTGAGYLHWKQILENHNALK